MARIDKASLYAIQVQTPPGLNDLLGTILPNGRFQSGTDFMPDRLVPCLIYKEWISGIDGASLLPFSRRVIVARTNHNGLQGNLQHSVDRDILSLSSKGMSDLNRGKILVAFCEIEFIVDILICHKLGVYSGENTYENVKKEYFSEEGDLATFEKKREFLLQENIITKNISSELQKAQRIRNSVAHNYFLDKNMGFSGKAIAHYGSIEQAIELKFNYAWLLMIQVYNNCQVDIVRWAYHGRLEVA